MHICGAYPLVPAHAKGLCTITHKKITGLIPKQFWFGNIVAHVCGDLPGEIKVSTSTVAALFSKMALTGQRIAMVDMVFLVFTAFPYLP